MMGALGLQSGEPLRGVPHAAADKNILGGEKYFAGGRATPRLLARRLAHTRKKHRFTSSHSVRPLPRPPPLTIEENYLAIIYIYRVLPKTPATSSGVRGL